LASATATVEPRSAYQWADSTGISPPTAIAKRIRATGGPENPDPSRFEVGPFGILRIRKTSGSPSNTMAQVRAVQEALENEELKRVTQRNAVDHAPGSQRADRLGRRRTRA
jgi:hypothetical protein